MTALSYACGILAGAMQTVTEPERRTPVAGEYDVVVLGGGPAGIAAAACAARHGAHTMLVERYGFLGGMGTAAGVTNFCGLFANVHGDIRRVVHGIATEILERIDRLGGLNAPHRVFGKTDAQVYDMSAYKCAADGLLLDSGAAIIFHALGAGVAMKSPRTIDALIVETKSGRRARASTPLHRRFRRRRPRGLVGRSLGKGGRGGRSALSQHLCFV